MRKLECRVTCRVLPMPISSAKIPPCDDHEAQQQPDAERGRVGERDEVQEATDS